MSTFPEAQTTKMESRDWGWRFCFDLFSFPRVTLNTRHTMLDHTGLSCSSPAFKILREYRVPRSCSRDTETDKTQRQAGRQAGTHARTHTCAHTHTFI